jgi:hypothetical protein
MSRNKVNHNPLPYDLSLICKVFQLEVGSPCQVLTDWMSATYVLDSLQQMLYNSLIEETEEDGGYWNEEELKVKFVGIVFRIADIAVKHRIKVFYERPLEAHLHHYDMSVVTDCLIATPLPFNTPDMPYFFLQEFKKKRGEKKDPEAQMLTAMLIAQHRNNDGKPLYGGYLFGHNWHFTTLIGNRYCSSRQYDARLPNDLLQIIFNMRKLKELILNR